jgi:HSP20 family protein
MSLSAWNPSADFERFFNRFAEQDRKEAIARSDWEPAVDIRETEHEYLIQIDLPEVRPEDVDVTVKNGVLVVSGERKHPGESLGRAHRIERRYGSFNRSFRLPKSVDDSRIEARARDGVLSLSVPKREEVKPRAIRVQVQ